MCLAKTPCIVIISSTILDYSFKSPTKSNFTCFGSEQARNTKMTMRSVKCLVVGDGGVGEFSEQRSLFRFQVNDFIETGKTSLLITYRENNFPQGKYSYCHQQFSMV